MARRATRWKQFLLAFFNFILGFGVCIVAYASFCLWKEPTELQLTSKDGAEYVANLEWGEIGYLRSILSCFALMCTTLLVYWRSRKRKEDSLDCDVEQWIRNASFSVWERYLCWSVLLLHIFTVSIGLCHKRLCCICIVAKCMDVAGC